MAYFSPLMAAICSGVWGTPANFNRFCVLDLLLHRRRSPEANQTLHDLWPSPGLVCHVYIFWGYCPLTEFCHVQSSLCVQVLLSSILAALLHSTRSAGQPNFAALSRGRYLYLAGRPSRWALAHILVLKCPWQYLVFFIQYWCNLSGRCWMIVSFFSPLMAFARLW